MVSKSEAVLTHLTLANTVELIVSTVQDLAGGDVSTHLNGALATGDILTEASATALQSELAVYLN